MSGRLAGRDAGAGRCVAGAPSQNRYGRTSRLDVEAVRTEAGTVLGPTLACAPFRVMKPFASAGDGFLGLVAMSSSAGLMAGDEQQVRVRVGERAALAMSAQAFEKVHRMADGGCATRATTLAVGRQGRLSFVQQPVIPFAGSRFHATCAIDLTDASASVAYAEVVSCGRAARGERFAFEMFENRVRIEVAGHPIYRDTMVFDPHEADLEGIGGFEGFSHLASLVVVAPGLGDEAVARARGALEAARPSTCGETAPDHAVAGGATALEPVAGAGGVAVRLLGCRAQDLLRLMAAVMDAFGFPVARGVAR